MHARMMAALPYERATINGANALFEWQHLTKAGKGWPVLIGDDDALERIAEQFSMDDPSIFGTISGRPEPRAASDILAAAKQITFPRDLQKWSGAYRPEDLHAEMGAWPSRSNAPATEPVLTAVFDLRTGRPIERVHVLFIPTDRSWEVPAHLRWGDWNACPPPE